MKPRQEIRNLIEGFSKLHLKQKSIGVHKHSKRVSVIPRIVIEICTDQNQIIRKTFSDSDLCPRKLPILRQGSDNLLGVSSSSNIPTQIPLEKPLNTTINESLMALTISYTSQDSFKK
jgi:hypothetical protein